MVERVTDPLHSLSSTALVQIQATESTLWRGSLDRLQTVPPLYLSWERCCMTPYGQNETHPIPHSEHRFLAPSSKLSQNWNSARVWLRHWRGTVYLRAAVHQRCQRPPKGVGTSHTGCSIAYKQARKHEAWPPRVTFFFKGQFRFKRYWLYLCWRKQRMRISKKRLT